jgi:hypothetical protein
MATGLSPAERKVATRLLERQMTPTAVADLLSIPVAQVDKLSRTTSVVRVYRSAEDEELATALRRVAWMSIEVAVDVLQFGNFKERSMMARTIITRLMPLIGGDSPIMMEELRAEFDTLMGKIQIEDEDAVQEAVEAGSLPGDPEHHRQGGDGTTLPDS